MNNGNPEAKVVSRPPKVNATVKNALMSYFLDLFQYQKATDLNYFVVVDVNPKMFVDRCHRNMLVTPIEASEAICISLIRSEPNNKVTVGCFVEGNGIELIPCDKQWTVPRFHSEFKILESKAGTSSVSQAINWALTRKMHVDVFVILSNYQLNTKHARTASNTYRSELKLDDTKVVTCSLTGHVASQKEVQNNKMMYTVGFDEHICPIIRGFARGDF